MNLENIFSNKNFFTAIKNNGEIKLILILLIDNKSDKNPKYYI